MRHARTILQNLGATNPIAVIFIIFCATITLLLYKIIPAYYYPSWDEAHHLVMASAYHLAISQKDPSMFWGTLIEKWTIYPPAFHILTAVAGYFLGVHEKIGLAINLPFLLLLGISTHKLSRVVGLKNSDLFAGFLVFFVPLFLNLATDAMTDMVSIALFITLYWAVFKTNYFSSTRWSLVTGAISLLLILTRYAFFSAALPLLVYALVSIKSHKLRAVYNLSFVAILLLPALVWYAPHWTEMNSVLKFYGDPNNYPVKLYNLPTLYEIDNWMYFLRASVQREGIGLIPMAGFLLFLFSGFYKRAGLARYIFWSIICNVIIQTVWLDKIPKYISYSYPLMLILTLGWITQLKRGSRAALLIITGAMVINVAVAIYHFPVTTPLGKLSQDVYLLPGVHFPYAYEAWPLKQIVSDIPINNGGPTKVLILTDNKYLNRSTFSYYATVGNIPITLYEANALYDPSATPTIQIDDLTEYSYIFIKTEGDIGIFVNRETTNKIYDLLQNPTNFSLYKSYPLPDNTHAWLYKSAPSPRQQ